MKHVNEDQARNQPFKETENIDSNLESFAEIIVDIAIDNMERNAMLEKFPNGYRLDQKGTCRICGDASKSEHFWYDKFGVKCMTCQKAIDKKIIPASLAKNSDDWYSTFDLETYFNIKGAILNRLIRQNILMRRIIPDSKNKIHLQLFLIKDNRDVLPPKKLLKSRIIQVMKNGEEYYAEEYWYEFADLKLLNKLKKYKIIYQLEEAFSKPIVSGRLLHKKINPLFVVRR